MANGNGDRLYDGTVSFAGGVSADNNKTVQSPAAPDGVPRNAVSWAINCTVRGGALGQRAGWIPLVQDAPWPNINYQAGLMYQPDFADPHLLLLINGHIYQVRVDTDNSVRDLSAIYGPTLPVIPKSFANQAEMFAIFQAGDLISNPIFYDFGVAGVPTRPEVMRFSNGFIGIGNAGNEIPPAGPSNYWQNRQWYAFGRQYCAGDITGNQTSGSINYEYRDAILHVTENPVATGGDGFIVPTMSGDIRALDHTSNIDTNLGQSPLFVMTRRSVYTCEAPITRADWIAADKDHQPLQKLLLAQGGTYSDRSVVAVNSDLFFQSPPNGDIRSVAVSVRNDREWGHVPLSRNVNRALILNDRSMLRFATGIQFDNRLLSATLPILTPAGVAFQGVLPLNFDLISTLEERRPPAWEGIWQKQSEPIYILQMFEGDFGGRQRAFAVCWSLINQAIEIWELTNDQRFDVVQDRIIRVFETPAYNAGEPFTIKELETAELWIDGIIGTSDIEIWYRPDSWMCWIPWHAFQICAAKDCREDALEPCSSAYPEPFCEQDRSTITLPKPKPECIKGNARPSTIGFQFQMKLRIRGACRVRGILLHMLPRYKAAFDGLQRIC